MPGVRLNHRDPSVHNTFWMVTVVVDDAYGLPTRELMAAFDERGIDTRPFFPPLSSLGAFAGYDTVRGARERNPVAYDIGRRAINLPVGDEARRERRRSRSAQRSARSSSRAKVAS